MKTKLTQQRLLDLFVYNQETGKFIRKINKKGRHAGSEAGCKETQGYIRIQVDGAAYRAHRLAWLYLYGFMPKIIDHINGDRSDNRIENLREANQRINNQNRRPETNNQSGYIGVSKSRNKWRATITDKKKSIHIGVFETKELAYQAYLETKRIVHEGSTL